MKGSKSLCALLYKLKLFSKLQTYWFSVWFKFVHHFQHYFHSLINVIQHACIGYSLKIATIKIYCSFTLFWSSDSKLATSSFSEGTSLPCWRLAKSHSYWRRLGQTSMIWWIICQSPSWIKNEHLAQRHLHHRVEALRTSVLCNLLITVHSTWSRQPWRELLVIYFVSIDYRAPSFLSLAWHQWRVRHARPQNAARTSAVIIQPFWPSTGLDWILFGRSSAARLDWLSSFPTIKSTKGMT